MQRTTGSLMYARLEGKKVVPTESLTELAEQYEKPESRIVGRTVISRRKNILVSTVFLAMDHGFGRRPLWFETMVFGSSMEGFQRRYETYEEAERGHAEIVGYARNARLFKRPENLKRRRVRRFIRRTKKWTGPKEFCPVTLEENGNVEIH